MVLVKDGVLLHSRNKLRKFWYTQQTQFVSLFYSTNTVCKVCYTQQYSLWDCFTQQIQFVSLFSSTNTVYKFVIHNDTVYKFV